MHTFFITPAPITLENIGQLLETGAELKLSPESILKIRNCRDYLDRKISEQTEPVYGITTGFGALHNRSIPAKDLSQLQVNLVISHACGVGSPVDPEIVRLMLFLKAYAWISLNPMPHPESSLYG